MFSNAFLCIIWNVLTCVTFLFIFCSETTEERQLKQKQKEERQIIEKLIDGMSRNIVDHLDMDISEEKQFIDEYLAKLNSLK